VARLPVSDEQRARGARLRDLRKRLGLTQEDVFPGKKREQVSNAEAGRNALTGIFGRELAQRYGVTPGELIAYADGKLEIQQLLAAKTPTQAAQEGATSPDRSLDDVLRLVRPHLTNPDDTALVVVTPSADGTKRTIEVEDPLTRRRIRIEETIGDSGNERDKSSHPPPVAGKHRRKAHAPRVR
jgi:transcriptional regulator with XRE-family HTH domain